MTVRKGEVVNEYGDIDVGGRIAETGIARVTMRQALRAAEFGWKIVRKESDDAVFIWRNGVARDRHSPPGVRHVKPHTLGWLKRPEVPAPSPAHDTWELPDGKLIALKKGATVALLNRRKS